MNDKGEAAAVESGSVSLRVGLHKAAIATNNAGVALLNRGFYREALCTFKDSMKLIQGAKRHKRHFLQHISFVSDEFTAKDVSATLSRTWQRAAQCQRHNFSTAPSTPSDSNMCSSNNGTVMIQTLSSQCSQEECDVSALLSPMLTTPTFHSVFPMTIDPIDFEAGDDKNDKDDNKEVHFDFQSAIILYNYGITYDCLAICAAQQGNRNMEILLQEKTFRIYQMVDALLDRLHRKVEKNVSGTHISCGYYYSFCYQRLLVLQTFVAFHLSQTCLRLEMPVSYGEQSKKLEELLHCLSAQQDVMFPTNQNSVAVAA